MKRACRYALAVAAWAACWGTALSAPSLKPPVPVVDPADPGENLPPRGRSLFDRVFAVARGGGAEIELPFPFAALLARLDAQLQHDPADPLPPAKRVLIPLGRSLQRTAAAPDYFAFPRVVVAVDAPPAGPAAPLLKDRLYLGYQEKSAVLEVISYNEEAGRFEFQLVKDYRAGGKPRVVYARRGLCFACHQNGAPIFSRGLWDETNANPQVAALLVGSGRRFYGIAPERGIDIPYAIDNATERANGFALSQRLWQEGCGGDHPAARRCRAGLFAGALRHALSGGQTWRPDPAFAAAVAAPLSAEAGRRWPAGLAPGNPDLPNRNPLQGVAAWPAEAAARIAFSHVPARFDPLLPRPLREAWRPDAAGLEAALRGLAEFVAGPDRLALAALLGSRPGVVAATLRLPCRRDDGSTASRWSLRCTAPDGAALDGTVTLQAGRVAAGHLRRLALPGGTAINGIELRPAGPALAPWVDGRPVRTAAGDALTGIEFRGRGDDLEARLTIRQDFALAAAALDRLAEGAAAATLFAPAPFPREALFAALFRELGGAPPPHCCAAARALPPPRLETPAAAPNDEAGGSGRDFLLYCATCHRTDERFPPNFLAGSAAEIDAKLRHCAPRLYVRLAVADLPPERRGKTPMPPESLLPAFGTDAAAWAASPVRAGLMTQVEAWLQAESGRSPQLDALLAGGYEALRPCLPAP